MGEKNMENNQDFEFMVIAAYEGDGGKLVSQYKNTPVTINPKKVYLAYDEQSG